MPEPDPPVWKIYEAISKADGKVMSKDKLFVGPKKLTNEKTTDRQTERQGYRKTDKHRGKERVRGKKMSYTFIVVVRRAGNGFSLKLVNILCVT